ncbi:hypothetical protein [Leptospira kanakyensis]|uniref:hypothetical protein n=1 Tax=Leptospira kanakyensis TaxID=2484968 RepID=UPI00142DDE13|nr:hypothetical protein [Leptospira kanakyensis]
MKETKIGEGVSKEGVSVTGCSSATDIGSTCITIKKEKGKTFASNNTTIKSK